MDTGTLKQSPPPNNSPLSIVKSRSELEIALSRTRLSSPRPGHLPVKPGDATQEGIALSIAGHGDVPGREHPRDALIARGAVDNEAMRHVLLAQLGIPCVDLSIFPVDPNALKALAPEQARKYKVLPLMRTEAHLAVAMADPLAWQTVRDLEFLTGLRVEPVLAGPQELASALHAYYGAAVEVERVTQLVAKLGEEQADAFAEAEPQVNDSDNTLVRVVNKTIMDAYAQRASDIHIESRPNHQASRIRFRIDGELRPYIEVPANFRAALISRVKIMCDLDISEHRRPQDGKIRFEEAGMPVLELRVVIMPTLHGLEDVVMRILAPPTALSLDQLGLSPRVLEQLKEIAGRSFGLLFVCGPTGSGKTTTLHSFLSFVNTPNRKIWTVEDPVEITQDGLCQVEVNTKLGLTFPYVLRSFLRADPDIIMVGETRDPETAHTVTTASLTGHLVVSTMHTNSAAESVIRLLDFGLDPFNFSDALLGVMGQRLVRRLCKCKTPYSANDEDLAKLAAEYCRQTQQDPAEVIARWRSRYGASGKVTLYAARGCAACENTGYKGRQGVYELLLATSEIKAAIQRRLPAEELLRLATRAGMVTFEQDAIEKILQGHLDLHQVLVSCR